MRLAPGVELGTEIPDRAPAVAAGAGARLVHDQLEVRARHLARPVDLDEGRVARDALRPALRAAVAAALERAGLERCHELRREVAARSEERVPGARQHVAAGQQVPLDGRLPARVARLEVAGEEPRVGAEGVE